MSYRERSLSELWARWKYKAKSRVYPFEHTVYTDMERAFGSLESYDPDKWAKAFSAEAVPYRERAVTAEAENQPELAAAYFLNAYGHYRVARFPTVNSSEKKAAYDNSREMFLAAARYFKHPLERISIPFDDGSGQGGEIIGYLCSAVAKRPGPIVVHWGGIDSFKEERYGHINVPEFIANGLSVLLIDMPGTGEAPVDGSGNAQLMFDTVLDWIDASGIFDPHRICAYGGSFGGYWAAMLAHTRAERLACVVNHGGCIHHAFDEEWIAKAPAGEYPFEFAKTHARAFGLNTAEEWIDYAPRLSLLEAGILDRPSAPMLLVNGIHDTVFPITDTYLLMQHGTPKSVRLYRRGHMGMTVDTLPTILNWVKSALG